MGLLPASSFQDYCATLTDPRCPDAPNRRHPLRDILLIAVCAVRCGAEGWEGIEESGTAHAQWFAAIFDFPHGLPGHDTFRRVVSRRDPRAWTRCFSAWTEALRAASGGAIVSIDGKTLPALRVIVPLGQPPSIWCVRGPVPIVWWWARSQWRKRPTQSPLCPNA